MHSRRLILIFVMILLTGLMLSISSFPSSASQMNLMAAPNRNSKLPQTTPQPAGGGKFQDGAVAPKTQISTCTQLYKQDDLQSPSTITFDDKDLYNGYIIGTYYQSTQGVVFNNTAETAATIRDGTIYSRIPFVAENVAANQNSAGLPFTITFDTPQSQVGMLIGGGDGSAITAVLTAYDSLNAIICQVSQSVPQMVSSFIGLKDDAGAEIARVTLDYGSSILNEVMDDLVFSDYIPPLPCAVAWKGYPASVNVGSRVTVSWEVTANTYYATQTYLVYDSVSHPQTGLYSSLQVPSPNTGSGVFSSGILARSVGMMYIRPALSYQETKGAAPITCQGADEIAVTINSIPPTPSPTPGSISGYVRDSKGNGIVGAEVSLCPELGCPAETSKAGGAFTFTGIAPGSYAISASMTGYQPYSSSVTVRTGQATSVVITLRPVPTPTPPPPPSGTISAFVRERDTNLPLSGASLELRPYLGNTNTHFDYATSAADGSFSFTNVPVGSWFVFATKRDYNFFFNIYHVTAGGSANGDIILQPRYRIPTPLPSSIVDLTVAHVMAIQASQKWDNSLPLAANRETALRVFVDLGGGAATDLHGPVMGYLYSPECLPELGLDSSYAAPMPVLNWATSNAQRDVVLSDAARTLNFILPLSCTTPGTRHFRVRIRPTVANPERNFTNNEFEISLTFNQRRPLMVFVRRISLGNSPFCARTHQPEPPASAIAPALRLLRQMYPTPVNWIDIGREDFCASPRIDYYEHLAGWGWINFGLSVDWSMFAVPSAPGYGIPGTVPPVPMVYGLVDGAECAPPYSCAGGQTPMLFSHHWVSSGLTSRISTAPHEVGHARGLLHASNDHNEAWGGDYISWPYRHGAMSVQGDAETWGYDPHEVDDAHPQGTVHAPISPTFTILDPDTGYPHELMSYGRDPRWLSDINWNNLYHSFRLPWTGDEAQPKPRESASDLPRLLIGGYEHPVDGLRLTAIRPTVMEISPVPAGATHTLQLKALDGTILASQEFKSFRWEGDKFPSFQLVVACPEGVVSVDILEGTTVVASYFFSSELPEVSITSPTGSGTYDTNLTLDWEASDPDGHPLSFDIAYSPDGGATWHGVVSLLPSATRTYDIDLTSLPGSENVLLKVIASDGFNTSSAITPAPVTITRKPPTAIVLSLADGDRFRRDEIIPLEGMMMDAEDQSPAVVILLPEDQPQLTEDSFVWTSDLDGIIGVGQNTTTYGLTPGTHKITLTVTDSDGMVGSASVQITLPSPAIFLPLINR